MEDKNVRLVAVAAGVVILLAVGGMLAWKTAFPAVAPAAANTAALPINGISTPAPAGTPQGDVERANAEAVAKETSSAQPATGQ